MLCKNKIKKKFNILFKAKNYLKFKTNLNYFFKKFTNDRIKNKEKCLQI